MRKIMIYILLALLALIVIMVAVWGLRVLFDLQNPLRQPSEQIKESILELTPIGTSMEEVVKVVESNKRWGTPHVNYEIGVLMGSLGKTGPNVGVQSIRADIGKYRNFYVTYVDVLWAFDENSKLIEIFVRKGIVGV